MHFEEYADVPVSRPGLFTHRSSGSLLVSSAVHDKAVRLHNVRSPFKAVAQPEEAGIPSASCLASEMLCQEA